MRRQKVYRALGIVIMVAAAGCEDLPTAVEGSLTAPFGAASTTGKSAAPVASASGSPAPGIAIPTAPTPNAFGSAPTVRRSPPSFASPFGSPAPLPSASASTAVIGSPSPIPSGSPGLSTPATLRFDDPLSTEDFSKASFAIKLKAEAPAGVVIKEMALFYDGIPLKRQETADSLLSIVSWNPHVVNSVDSKDLTAVPFGPHVLRGEVTTTAGTITTSEFRFDKPFLMRGWRDDVLKETALQDLPALLPARSHMGVVSTQHRLFSFFGENAAGEVVNKLEMCNLDAFNPIWLTRSLGSLQPRRRAGIVNQGDLVYLIGGLVAEPPSGPLEATDDVAAFDLFQNTLVNPPNLPFPRSDVATAVVGKFLYAVGGTDDDTDAGAAATVFRLELAEDGTPRGTAWEARTPLPNAIGRRSAVAVAFDDELYLLGGINQDGIRQEPILKYDPSANTWSHVGLLPRGLSHAAAVQLGGAIWIFGGHVSDTEVTRLAVRFDPRKKLIKTFADIPNLPAERAGMGAAVVDGQLYLVGGHGVNSTGQFVPVGDLIRADSL